MYIDSVLNIYTKIFWQMMISILSASMKYNWQIKFVCIYSMQLDTLIHMHIVKWSPQLSYKHCINTTYIIYHVYIIYVHMYVIVHILLSYIIYNMYYKSMYCIWCTFYIHKALDFQKLLIWHNWGIVYFGQHLPISPCSKSLELAFYSLLLLINCCRLYM